MMHTSLCERFEPEKLEATGIEACQIKPVKVAQLQQSLLKLIAAGMDDYVFWRIFSVGGFVYYRMSMSDMNELLRAYAKDGSEPAFERLVACTVDLVYFTALRRVNSDAHRAQDIVQIVYCDLARKARLLPSDVRISGWLHRHTCFVASTFMRGEQRRLNRERIAIEMNADAPEASWTQVAPVVDEAIDQLEAEDRDAIMLRFFEQRDLRAVGAAMGTSENAAQKRISRALVKLRTLLAHQGIVLSASAIASLLTAQVLAGAPSGLAASLAKTALRANAAGGAGASLVKLLASAKIKFALGAAAVAILLLPILWSQRVRSSSTVGPAGVVSNATSQSFAVNVPVPKAANADTGLVAPIPTQVLQLAIVADENGKPLPNVSVGYWGWEDQKFKIKHLQSTRLGICDVDIPLDTTKLELWVRVDGFADSLLTWQPENGGKIPVNYTLKLVRPVLIGGQVVDPQGQPVADARVGFGCPEVFITKAAPESHAFRNVEAFTDAEGRWRLNRIAPDVIHLISASASHPNHVQSESIELSRDALPLSKLRDETHIFHLGQAVTIEGMVVDAGDAPIAQAQVRVGYRDMSGSREASSASDGTFRIVGCQPGRTVLSAQAKGYAPLTMDIQATTNSQPFKLVLNPGRTLRLRIVDTMGKPIPKASIRLNTFPPGGPNGQEPAPVQAALDTRADDQGCWVWDSAPERELEFSIFAHGYFLKDSYRVVPDGQEHVIILPPALLVSGSVCDAISGQQIPKFRIICGWPQTNHLDGVITPQWNVSDLNYAGGRYRHLFERAMTTLNSGPAYSGYMLKFEAEGYAPFISRPILASEGEVRLDVKLSPGSTHAVISVVLPDGNAASQTPVGLVSKGSQFLMSPGRLERQGSRGDPFSLKTDAQGSFRLPADPSIQRVIVTHADGFADTTPAALASDPVIRLQPWGRLEGTYYTGGKPAAGRELYFELGNGDFTTVLSDFKSFGQTVDDQGRFAFPKVPPGKHTLVWRRPVPGVPEKAGKLTEHRTLTEVEIGSGETALVNCATYAITAQLHWPEGHSRPEKCASFGIIHMPIPDPPADTANSLENWSHWFSSPENQAFLTKSTHYDLRIEDDGKVSAVDILPGNYVLQIFFEVATSSGKGETLAAARRMIAVPADATAGLLDLGEIILQQ